MKYPKIIVLYIVPIFIFSFSILNAQKTAQIKITDISESKNKLLINYTVSDLKKGELLTVWPKVNIRTNSFELGVKNLSGDFGQGIKGNGDKTIIWNLEKDNIFLDEYVYIKLDGKISQDFSFSRIMNLTLYSTIFPGMGRYKLTGKKKELLHGISGYTELIVFAYNFKKMQTNHELYLIEADSDRRKELYQLSSKHKLNAIIWGSCAIVEWSLSYFKLFSSWKWKKHLQANTESNWNENISFAPSYNFGLNQAQFSFYFNF